MALDCFFVCSDRISLVLVRCLTSLNWDEFWKLRGFCGYGHVRIMPTLDLHPLLFYFIFLPTSHTSFAWYMTIWHLRFQILYLKSKLENILKF